MKWLKYVGVLTLGLGLALGVFADDTNVEKEHGIKVVIDTDREISPSSKDKLTSEQIFELEKIKAQQPEVPSLAPLIVGIVFACPVAIVAVILIYRYRRNQLLHKTLASMIEKGVPIPPELLQPEKRPKSDLQRAFVLIGVGLGLIIFFLAMHNNVWGVGFIPLFMGVGYLLAWKLARKNGNS